MDLLFLAVVTIVKFQSQLVLCGPAETSLAERAYGGNISAGGILMDLRNRVSRKSEFIPVLASTIQSGWNHSGEKWHGL